MASRFISPRQVLDKATEALQHGDKHAARTWAQIAASLAPDMEDPWLILAAVARPRASIAYIERALAINPQSKRAQAGMEWAHQQQAKEREQSGQNTQIASARAILPTRPDPVVQGGKPSSQIPSKTASRIRISIPILVLVLALCLVAVWFFWPGMGSSASAAILGNPASSQDSQILSWLPVGLLKPTDTPLPTATMASTPTAIPNAIPSPTPFPPVPDTPTPSPTVTLASTDTPVPTNMPQPTTGQDSVAPQAAADGGKLIVVYIHQQHLYAYQGNMLVFSFVASTGGNNSTRTGTFSILDKIPKAWGANWNFWMPYWMGIYHVGSMENGIHSLPLLPDGELLWGDEIGTPITYGCVVLDVQDSRALYNWADVGTTVQIKP